MKCADISPSHVDRSVLVQKVSGRSPQFSSVLHSCPRSPRCRTCDLCVSMVPAPRIVTNLQAVFMCRRPPPGTRVEALLRKEGPSSVQLEDTYPCVYTFHCPPR